MKVLTRFNLSVFFQTQFLMLPVLLLFYQQFGLGLSELFLFQSIFSFTCLLLDIPTGYLSDFISKKTILLLSYSFYLLRLFIWIFFAKYGFWIILLGEVLYAFNKSFFSGASDCYIYEFLNQHANTQKIRLKIGKFNFWMSFGTALSSIIGSILYNYISRWSMVKFQTDLGFLVLLSLEFILNTVAILFVISLPKIPAVSRTKTTLKMKYREFFSVFFHCFKEKKICHYAIISGILAAESAFLAWNFQSISSLLQFPAYVLGFIYFCNHLIRAVAGVSVNHFLKKISLEKFGVVVFSGFLLSFYLITIISSGHFPIWLSLSVLFMSCLMIGGQVIFMLGNLSRLHNLIESKNRTMISSINTTFGRFFCGILMLIFKVLLDGISFQNSFYLMMLLVLLALPSLIQINKVFSDKNFN